MAVFGGHVPVVTLLLGKITDINRVDNVSHQSLCAADIDLQCAIRNIDLVAYPDQDPHCILCNHHCILSNHHCILSNHHCILSNPHCILSNHHCILSNPHCILSNPHCILSNHHCILSNHHCILYNHHCILSNHHCILSNPHCIRLHTVWMDSSHGGSCVRARSCRDLSPRQRS
jgi:hypothetical protein